MRTFDSLKEGDYVAFGFNYDGGEPNEIIVDQITSVYEDKVLVHFLYGVKGLSEFVNKEKILAVGNEESGEGRIKGWTGKYDILKQEEIDKFQKEC